MDSTPTQGPPRRAVFARHAASLLVIRETAAGPEVLMGMRGHGHRFMPNRLVFPGGAVDPGDGVAPASAEPPAELLAVLGRRAGPRLARAIVLCAARELQEETGLTLGTPPSLGGISYLCRAVTPPRSPIRFNARFLMVSADQVGGTLADTEELTALRFRAVAAAVTEDLALVTLEVLRHYLASRMAGSVPMVFRQRRWTSDA